MIAVLLLAQTDATGRTISWIVFGLVAVAAALALLTAWYWRVTDPAKRKDSANGGGGPRRRRREVDPEPDPGPADHLVAPVIPRSEGPVDGPPTDHTRVLTRSDILEPKVSQPPQIIDLRSEPEPAADAIQRADPAADVEPDGSAEVAVDESVVDLTELEGADQAESVVGAHDDGMDFDDWLALAEEDS